MCFTKSSFYEMNKIFFLLNVEIENVTFPD